jgi:hypothetical protein
MTQVVAKVCDIGSCSSSWGSRRRFFAFTRLGAGAGEERFVAEGVLRSYFLKNDKPVDVKMYAKVKPIG